MTPDQETAMLCRHCGREIVPTEFGTWQDKDNPGYEVCDLSDEAGPDHEPEPVAFVLDEDRAREILIEHVTTELGVSPGEAITGTTLDDFNGYWNRAVDEVCQLVFFGDQRNPANVGSDSGALRNANGYGVLVYPLDYEDSSDILITLRREPIWSEPTSFIQVADISCETRKIVDGNEPGLDPLIEMCRNVVAEMNRLKPYLDKIGVIAASADAS